MSHGTPGEAADGKLDLVPMIDCIMLLLLFFILTSDFKAEDLRISALLPTDSGTGEHPGPVIAPPPTVRIAIIPTDTRLVRVRIGGGEEIQIDPTQFNQPGGPAVDAALGVLHDALARRLAAYEQPGTRQEQPPVEIHCAKRIPWSCALVVYDGVRAYEKSRLPPGEIALEAQRNVAFAAPVVRNSRGDNPFDEMERLERLR